MISRRITRQIAVLALAGALIISGIAVPASAKPKAGHGRGYEKSSQAHARNELRKVEREAKTSAKAHGKSEGKGKGKAKAAEAKARKTARFQANGTLLAVVGNTISVAVSGGQVKAWRGAIIDFDATDAVVNRDDVAASLLDLQAGDHVAVKGLRVDGVNVAKRVNAASPEPVVEEPTEDVVIDEPTEDVVTDEPTEDVVTDESTEDVVTEEPTDDVVTDEVVTP